MSVFEAFFQGLIQGLTEFLPVSSSGHLSLFQYFTGNNSETGFVFSILLHAGTLIAVCIVFWRTIVSLIAEAFSLIGDLFSRRFSTRDMRPERRMLLFLLLSVCPLFLMVLIKDRISAFSTDNDITVEGLCFLFTGILLTWASRHDRGRKDASNMKAKDAVAVGVAQVVATMPGISRSGSTICTGMLWGLRREFAVSYSFILGIPAVLGAIVLEIPDAVSEGTTLPLPVILTGLISSAVFGVLAIKLVQWVVKGNKLRYFGWYTLALGTVVLIIGTIDNFTGHALQQGLVG